MITLEAAENAVQSRLPLWQIHFFELISEISYFLLDMQCNSVQNGEYVDWSLKEALPYRILLILGKMHWKRNRPCGSSEDAADFSGGRQMRRIHLYCLAAVRLLRGPVRTGGVAFIYPFIRSDDKAYVGTINS